MSLDNPNQVNTRALDRDVLRMPIVESGGNQSWAEMMEIGRRNGADTVNNMFGQLELGQATVHAETKLKNLESPPQGNAETNKDMRTNVPREPIPPPPPVNLNLMPYVPLEEHLLYPVPGGSSME